jgi:hypothetical protein
MPVIMAEFLLAFLVSAWYNIIWFLRIEAILDETEGAAI